MKTFHDGKITLHSGDCLDVLKAMPENSIDAVVTDPPYHLIAPGSKTRSNIEQPANKNLNGVNAGSFRRLAKGFMGKQWDGGDIAFRPELWAEVLRVLKPGGHMVCFGGTRTYHRMVCAIEDAGFEVRDQLAWVFGSGFPKSHDVSKGIEKHRVDDVDCWRPIGEWLKQRRIAAGYDVRKTLAIHFVGYKNIESAAADLSNWENGLSIPTLETWRLLKRLLSLPNDHDAEVERLNDRKGEFGAAYHQRAITGAVNEWTNRINYTMGGCDNLRRDIPFTDAGRQWQGWGTALKPAFEPICLARKPLSESTVAANVLRWGTGALNIDATRIQTAENLNGGAYSGGGKSPEDATSFFTGTNAGTYEQPSGRWPANLCHDGSPEVLAGFPETSPSPSKVTRGPSTSGYGSSNRSGEIQEYPCHGDSGSAARFFYTAKADADDRLNSKHPTVKPVDLVQWLVKLVCPKGATVLDPFAGTGTTGAAAFIEGRRCVSIEREAEYLADIEKRMELLLSGPDERSWKLAKPESLEALPLFALTKPAA